MILYAVIAIVVVMVAVRVFQDDLFKKKGQKRPGENPEKSPANPQPFTPASSRYCHICGQAKQWVKVDCRSEKKWRLKCPDCDQIPTKGGETSGQANNPSNPAQGSRGPEASLHPQPVSTRISRYSPDLHRRSPVDARRLAFLKSLKIRTAGEEKELRRLKRKRG